MPLPVTPVTIGELVQAYRDQLAPTDDVLVIVHNSDGRPCGWGIATTVGAATDEAFRQYESHECYEGERRGKVTTHHLPSKAL